MQRLTGNQAYDLIEAYNSIYESEQLTEEQIIESFNIWIEDLLNEGYDLSEYSYDDLYEYYLNEAPIPWGAVRNFAWRQIVKPFFAGAPKKEPGVTYGAGRSLKKLQGLTGRVLAPLAAVQVAGPYVGGYLKDRDKEYTGGAITKILGHGHNALKGLGAAIPEPGSSSGGNNSSTPKPTPAPTKPKNTYTFVPPETLTRPRPQKENFDAMDIVTAHLISEGYADDEYAAAAIIANMSDDWRQEIFNLYSLNEV